MTGVSPARAAAREAVVAKIGSLLPGQLGIDLVNEIADAVTDRIATSVEVTLRGRICDDIDACYDDPSTPERYRPGLRRAGRLVRDGSYVMEDDSGDA